MAVSPCSCTRSCRSSAAYNTTFLEGSAATPGWSTSSSREPASRSLLFRGYGFERLITAIGMWPAQLIVGAACSRTYHLLNGYAWQVAFTGSVIGSLMFGLVFVRTRSVMAATGFHAAANWARDVVLADPPTMRTWFGPGGSQLDPRRASDDDDRVRRRRARRVRAAVLVDPSSRPQAGDRKTRARVGVNAIGHWRNAGESHDRRSGGCRAQRCERRGCCSGSCLANTARISLFTRRGIEETACASR